MARDISLSRKCAPRIVSTGHHRSVLVKDTRLIKGPILPPPPYTSDKLYDLAVKMQVTGFLTPGQKTVAKLAAAGVVAYVVKRFAFGGGRSKL